MFPSTNFDDRKIQFLTINLLLVLTHSFDGADLRSETQEYCGQNQSIYIKWRFLPWHIDVNNFVVIWNQSQTAGSWAEKEIFLVKYFNLRLLHQQPLHLHTWIYSRMKYLFISLVLCTTPPTIFTILCITNVSKTFLCTFLF